MDNQLIKHNTRVNNMVVKEIPLDNPVPLLREQTIQVNAKIAQLEQDAAIQNVIDQMFAMDIRQMENERIRLSNIVHLQHAELSREFKQRRIEVEEVTAILDITLENLAASNENSSKLMQAQLQLKKDFKLIRNQQAELKKAFKLIEQDHAQIAEDHAQIAKDHDQIANDQADIAKDQAKIRQEQQQIRGNLERLEEGRVSLSKSFASLKISFKEISRQLDTMLEERLLHQQDADLSEKEIEEKAAVKRNEITKQYMQDWEDEIQREYDENKALNSQSTQEFAEQLEDSILNAEEIAARGETSFLSTAQQTQGSEALKSPGWLGALKHKMGTWKHTALKVTEFFTRSACLATIVSVGLTSLFAIKATLV
ncbi:hypothetical protein DB41_AS00020 [Neochlamydia sp. TUME1]|nr:hypothetical protein DB41_AS00020 [Neochlamydia sp. TUME1]